MIITDVIERGISRAYQELGHLPGAELAPAQVGTVWKYVLLALLSAQSGGEEALRRRLTAGEIDRDELSMEVERLLPEAATVWPGTPLPEALQQRVLMLAVDAVQSERLCPELLLSPSPISLPDRPIHALIFSAFPHITNELYPLMVDAYVARSECDVIGIHEQWLTGRTFRRAIFCDEQRLELYEADICGQPAISSAQVLALDLRHERQPHRRIEHLLQGIRVFNPSTGARKLDDKAWTGCCWQQAGLPTPAFRVLPRNLSSAAAQQTLDEFAGGNTHMVLKPADGTEGRGVTRLHPHAADTAGLAAALAQGGAVLIMAEHGSVHYHRASAALPLTIRLNVSWDGEIAQAESGYAQVAQTPTGIASVGRGGSIVPLWQLWPHLCLAHDRPFTPDEADWRRLLATAEAGVCALAAALSADMPVLVGIDLLLDVDAAGRLFPLLLEANPRPAGLGHAHLVEIHGPTREPGVSSRIWRTIP